MLSDGQFPICSILEVAVDGGDTHAEVGGDLALGVAVGGEMDGSFDPRRAVAVDGVVRRDEVRMLGGVADEVETEEVGRANGEW